MQYLVNRQPLISSTKFTQLVSLLHASNPFHQLSAMVEIRNLLQHNNQTKQIQPLIELLSRPKQLLVLLKYLESKYPDHSRQASWLIAHIASFGGQSIESLILCNAVKTLVSLLSCDDIVVQEQCMWALGYIVGESAICRNYVIELNGFEPVLKIVSNGVQKSVTLFRNSVWTLSMFCKGKPRPDYSIISKALDELFNLVYSTDDDHVLIDALWGISYASDGKYLDRVVHKIMNSKMFERLGLFTVHDDDDVVLPALRSLCKISSISDYHRQMIVYYDMLPCFRNLIIDNERKDIRKLTAKLISNLLETGNKKLIQSVIDAMIFPPLVTSVFRDQSLDAARAIANAILYGTSKQLEYLVFRCQCTFPLGVLLTIDLPFPQVLIHVLQALERLLEVNQGK